MNIEKQHINFAAPQIADAIPGNNCFGLDTSNPDYLVFKQENIVMEIIGGMTDVVLSSLRVTLKVYKMGAVSPLEIYRSSQVDLFNEDQVAYTIQRICERLRIESSRCKSMVYDLIQRLDGYRRNKERYVIPIIPINTNYKRYALSVLRSDNVLGEITGLLQQAGVCDTRLGLQLFVAGISRITSSPFHSIILGSRVLANSFLSDVIGIFPKEHLREVTSLSKHALSYPPTEDYWDQKTLVLHQLESIRDGDSVLLEYIIQGRSKRLVTETNNKTGSYQSKQKDILSTINMISYTAKDYHPAFSSRYSLCLPISDSHALQDALYEKEVKELSGLWDNEAENRAFSILQQVQRELEPLSIYNPIIEQLDLTPFFGKDIEQLGKYLGLVNLITLLHQHKQSIKLTKTKKSIDVQPEYMKQALLLFRELWIKKNDELYFNVRGTFTSIKAELKKQHPRDYISQTFKLKAMRKILGRSPVTMQRHLKTLEDYGKIERCGGNNRIGYDYRVVEWQEGIGMADRLDELINQLSGL